MASRRVCLARVLVSLGDLTQVDELLDRAETDVNSRGERDPLWPRLLATRAAARTTGNKLDEAVPLLERALAASTRVFGEAHVESVRLLNQLAEVFMGRKEFAAAQTLLERGLALNRRRAWNDSMTEIALMVNLARVRTSQGDLAGARETYRQALRGLEAHVARNLHGLGERERLVLVNKLREPFLESIDLLAGDDMLDRETYGRLIVWKGIATSAARKEGQSKARNQRVFLTPGNPRLNLLGSSDPLLGMRERLAHICYERHTLRTTKAGDTTGATNPLGALYDREFERARTHDFASDALTSVLSSISTAESRDAGLAGAPLPRPDVQEVAHAIPERTVLLDFLRYTPRGGVPRYTVFVLRRDTAPRRFDVGPAAPIDNAVLTWRAAIESDSDDSDLATEIYRTLWAPIAPFCRDAGTILVAPDGELNHLPWAALPDLTPGAASGAFLLERYGFAQITSARRLIENAKLDAGHLGLLVVGGVDYNRREPAKKSSETTPPWFPEQVQSGQIESVWPAVAQSSGALGDRQRNRGRPGYF